MMIAKLIRLVAFSSALAVPGLALAQGTPPPAPPPSGGHGDFAKTREACKADVQRFCKDEKPGGGRIRDCLKAHRDELSDGCKTAIKEAREHHHQNG
jgi:hypothetical protein